MAVFASNYTQLSKELLTFNHILSLPLPILRVEIRWVFIVTPCQGTYNIAFQTVDLVDSARVLPELEV